MVVWWWVREERRREEGDMRAGHAGVASCCALQCSGLLCSEPTCQCPPASLPACRPALPGLPPPLPVCASYLTAHLCAPPALPTSTSHCPTRPGPEYWDSQSQFAIHSQSHSRSHTHTPTDGQRHHPADLRCTRGIVRPDPTQLDPTRLIRFTLSALAQIPIAGLGYFLPTEASRT